MEQESFKELFESSFRDFRVGQLVEGKVAIITSDKVFIDIGHKTESPIPLSEFEETPSLDDTIQAMVVQKENKQGKVLLSKKQADIFESTKVIQDSYENKLPVEGTIIKEVKCGYIVRIGGLEAFLPGSHISFPRGTPANEYLKKKLQFKIEQYDPQARNIVVSRKNYLKEDLQKKQNRYLQQLKEGDVIEATVKYVYPNKVLLNIQDILSGAILLKDLSWTRIKDCTSFLKEQQKINAKVLSIDPETKRLQLGLKQLTPDPLEDFAQQHSIGDTIEGKIVHIADFGAFVQFPQGVEGLIHISELSWTKRIYHPKEILKIGDYVTVKLLDIDAPKRKISLSLRQINQNPWDAIESEYPRGKKVTGKIVNIEEFGIFVGFDDGIVGLLHKTNIDWVNKVENMKNHERFKKGMEIEAIILDVDKKNQTLSLGLKQLLKNPYEIFKANHKKNSTIKATIKNCTDYGITVTLDNDLEAFIPLSEITKQEQKDLQSHYHIGQEINAVVRNIDTTKSKITLSIKDYERQEEKQTIQKYVLHSDEVQGHSMNLGEIVSLKSLMKQ